MKKLLSIICLFMPIVVMGATLSGNVIDANSSQPIEGMTLHLQRFYPNSWENFSYNTISNTDGSFTFPDIETGHYRLFTAYSDDYFTSYYSETFIIADEYQDFTDINIYIEPIISGRATISGLVIAEEMFMENTFYFITLKYYPLPDYEISMGFQEIDESASYTFDNLNIGNYKIGILFYGQFNGEIWYNSVYSEEDAQMILITPTNLEIQGVDFEISFNTLNQPYLHVEDVIIDYGYDNILTNGEEFNVSYQIKNMGNLPSENSSFFAYSPYQDVNMETVLEEISLLADQEIILGPYPVTIAHNIENEFNFHLFHSISDAFSHVSSPVFLTAYAPVIEIGSYEILSNNGNLVEGDNTVSLILYNTGGANVNYPVVDISTNDTSLSMGSYNQTNYYWMEAQNGQLEFIFNFEFMAIGNDLAELNFQIHFSSLNTDYLEIIDFNLPVQTITNNLEELQQVNEISLSNYPNPFNPQTIISFSLPQDSQIVLEIYNLKGQLVNRLANDTYAKGNHQVVWNGINQDKQEVASGVYLYKLQTGNSQLIRKMLLSK